MSLKRNKRIWKLVRIFIKTLFLQSSYIFRCGGIHSSLCAILFAGCTIVAECPYHDHVVAGCGGALPSAGLIAFTGTMLLLFSRNRSLVIVSGCIIGLDTGTFMASNWAMGMDLVPKAQAGKYLGISNLAGAGAGIVGAGIGGPMADFFNLQQPGLGYLVIFAIYGMLFLFSAVTLVKVKVD